MKIYIISPAYPYRGGLSDFTHRLTQELEIQEHEVHIISFKMLYPSFLFPGKTQFSEDPPSFTFHIKRWIHTLNPINWWRVGRRIQKSKPDIVIFRYWLPFLAPSLGTIGRIIKRNKHTQLLAITDNIIPHERRFGDKILTRYFISCIDKFITLSTSVATELEDYTSQPSLTLIHPVYDIYGKKLDKTIARNQLHLDENGKWILFFGLIRDYKGLDLLLGAMNDPRIRDRNIQLIIAGEYYGQQDFYEGLIQKYQLKKNIHLATHFISNHEVNKYFSAADVVVQPYKSATQSGISQIAFHFSKPMITTNVGGLPEVVKHDEVGLVTDVDASSIADAIVRFYDEDLEHKFSAAIEQAKKQYQWDYFVEKMIDFAQQ